MAKIQKTKVKSEILMETIVHKRKKVRKMPKKKKFQGVRKKPRSKKETMTRLVNEEVMEMPTVYLEDHVLSETVNFLYIRKRKILVENIF